VIEVFRDDKIYIIGIKTATSTEDALDQADLFDKNKLLLTELDATHVVIVSPFRHEQTWVFLEVDEQELLIDQLYDQLWATIDSDNWVNQWRFDLPNH
jgi:hypothetical protein